MAKVKFGTKTKTKSKVKLVLSEEEAAELRKELNRITDGSTLILELYRKLAPRSYRVKTGEEVDTVPEFKPRDLIDPEWMEVAKEVAEMAERMNKYRP